jgi:hypothetical protein
MANCGGSSTVSEGEAARTVVLWARQGKLKSYPTPSTHRHRWRFLHADLDAMLTKPSVALPKRRVERREHGIEMEV